MITIVGLGPAGLKAMSVEALEAVRSAPRLILRTDRHPAARELRDQGVEFQSLDSVYEGAETFEEVYEAIAEQVLAEGRTGDLAYAVPGHPLVAEESVRRLLPRARAQGIPVRIVGSSSFVEPVLAAVEAQLTEGLLLLDALALDSVRLRPEAPLLLCQVYDTDTASRAKLALMREYPDDWEIVVARAAGVPGEQAVERIPLHRLDRVAADHLTAIYVPPLPPERRRRTFEDLVWVMARLRGEGGCPWDREQDHQTLKRYLIEECYEVLDAIDAGDPDALAEELGDLLLQPVFHAQLEAEEGVFTIDDVVARIVAKLIHRHPHVFGDASVESADEVLRNWEKIKRAEKGEGWRESVLDGVPTSLPALLRALEVSRRAVKAGFEWKRFEDVLAKLDEEVRELREALERGQQDEIESEIGDLLFTLVNVARWKGIDPEEALRQMVNRFSARFRRVEQAARESGRPLESLSLGEMDALWEEAKTALGRGA